MTTPTRSCGTYLLPQGRDHVLCWVHQRCGEPEGGARKVPGSLEPVSFHCRFTFILPSSKMRKAQTLTWTEGVAKKGVAKKGVALQGFKQMCTITQNTFLTGTCQEPIKTHPEPARNLPGIHHETTTNPSGTCQEPIRNSSGNHQEPTRNLSADLSEQQLGGVQDRGS